MFAERLKIIREESELTQQELAALLSLSSSTIGMYEQDRRDPDTATVSRIAKCLNISADWLLGITDVRTQIGQEKRYLDITDLPEKETTMVQEYIGMLRNNYKTSEGKPKKKVRKNTTTSSSKDE